MKEKHFYGTGKLFRLYLRRDRFLLPIWILLPIFIVSGQVSFIASMPNWQEFIKELSDSPLTTALLGPITPLSVEGAILWRAMLQSSMIVMIGTALTVIRHTRTEEISGRNELIFGRAIGRYSNLTASLILSCTGSFLAGLLVSIVLIVAGFKSNGSIVAGSTLAFSGWLFAGIGGLCAQIFEQSSRSRSVIFGIYGVTMVPMVLNNMGGSNTGWAWLVPESWFRITVPFGDNNIWPVFIFAVFTVIPMILSYKLLSKRDMGAGITEPKQGFFNISHNLNSPLSFAYEQYKGVILIWIIGVAFIGAALGGIAPNISNSISSILVEMNSWAETMARVGNQQGFVATFIYILGLMAGLSIFSITMVLNLGREEKEHYTEMLLSRPVSRFRWMSSYLAITFIGSVAILISLGLASGLGWSIAAGDISYFSRALMMSISKIPSIWVIIGISAILYGWIPEAAAVISWSILGILIFIEMLWEVGVVDWSVLKLTPFAYAHYSIPIDELAIVPLIVLTGVAAILTCIGLWRFSKRDIY